MNTFAAVVVVMALVGGVLSADNIVELAKKLKATDLVKLVTDAGLADTLSSKGPFTVFAPTDEAFSHVPKPIIHRLLQNKTELTDLLTYHVVSGRLLVGSIGEHRHGNAWNLPRHNEFAVDPELEDNNYFSTWEKSSYTIGSVKSTDLTNEEVVPSLFANHSVRVNIYDEDKGKLVTVDGSPVVLADQIASNGVIHVVSKVLFPIPEGPVTALVEHDQQLSTLLTAVQKANLGATLAGPGPFTVFAPTNTAFERLPPGTLDKLLANVTQLTDVLTYHVVKGTFYSEGLKSEQDVPTVEGKNLHIVKQGIHSVTVNKARVVMPNLSVTNGVVHVIDGVLIPESIQKHPHFH